MKLGRLIHNQPMIAERLEVHSMSGIGRRLYEANMGTLTLASDEVVRELIGQAAAEIEDHKFSPHFLWTEWSRVVDAWQLESWEAYRDVMRLGRKTRLAEAQRTVLWSIFSKVRDGLAERGLLTEAKMFQRLEHHFEAAAHPPFEYCVIDEAQDIGVAELRFLAVLGGGRPDSLFFAGDLGQRIFRTPFSWCALGVDVRGRSHTLRINYRTSHQIRRQADRLLPPELADVDGITERRGGTVSAFNGPEPSIRVLESPDEEAAALAEWLTARRQEGYAPARDRPVRPIRSRDEEGTRRRPPRGPVPDSVERTLGRPIRQRRGRDDGPRQGPGVPGSGCGGVAMTRSCRCNRASRTSPTKPTWRIPTARSGTCSTWLARVPAIISW